MIKFSKKGEMDVSMENRCKKNILAASGLQFYTLSIGSETIFVIDDSNVDHDQEWRLEQLKTMCINSIKQL